MGSKLVPNRVKRDVLSDEPAREWWPQSNSYVFIQHGLCNSEYFTIEGLSPYFYGKHVFMSLIHQIPKVFFLIKTWSYGFQAGPQ